ncbi:MAG: hypothetical protein A3A43_03450 [Candidatus Liptonbacteria bacterium RIFCSPLOWO2_01_FULL_56_20]|uniref:Uncharacterized protein n=1 Tax=Candidatus Liptonbacteria bacterium RIFCSPLOWO2_01_FULL_56_20 TaxID=1798652 RepID=A0A1G2CHS8_9BACT|nr:MAG: hypothetical protein UY96_C0004G0023 [Parcubacteria group bacterium GW2011_GWB1_56_8]OGY97732.1 MAG: hypothetical protein A2681_02040 [Candidatus Liptonbacteria bacterium RIFCSPHIGHO2_01_FULL_56_18b]OGZ00946.1 MAG: hypothetical protein A3A43_03450 [Candidatus Liptonbacteria bacterium RIFCSPLOWO2_01_FULL_56_20]
MALSAEQKQEKVAKILRTDKHLFIAIEERLSALTGKKGVIENVLEENEEVIAKHLEALGLRRDARARAVYNSLISKVKADDYKMFECLGRPDFQAVEQCQKIAEIAKRVAVPPKGFFLKLDKAKELLRKNPPAQVMKFLGYDSVDRMLDKEDLFEVYSALRFVEGSEWLNAVFFKQYEKLAPGDFEEREVQVRALGQVWDQAAQSFARKKWHNISHLKEMGVVFIIPITLGIPGELLRMVSLLLHYLHEIPFYSEMFRASAKHPRTFSRDLVSLLRGDVLQERREEKGKSTWLVVQRYLAKDDENDWRLFVPRINPEALHWSRAETDLPRVGQASKELPDELMFWSRLGWAGDFFRDESGVDVLVSFNLVDTVMSLVKQREMVKYLYHHQEALWNKIFVEYFGREELERFSKKYLLQGYFTL